MPDGGIAAGATATETGIETERTDRNSERGRQRSGSLRCLCRVSPSLFWNGVMPTYTLEFERPILELEAKIQELKQFAEVEKMDFSTEIARLERRVARLQEEVFSNLTPWQRTQIARHPSRPYTMDYIRLMLTDFVELHGDRAFGDDRAIVGGLARLEGMPLVVIGHQKGRDTKEKLARNFAMANPEGYRKALRLMKLAEKFGKPVLTLVDTPGAYPGIGAEERGQAEAIARNLREMSELKVPIVVVIPGKEARAAPWGLPWATPC